MKLVVFAVLLASLSFIALPSCADLPTEIKAVLMSPLLSKADVGIAVVKLGNSAQTSTVIFRHESELPLIPASNLKVITTSAALDAFGPDFRFRTVLARHGDDLVLIGDGDPTLGDVELLKKVGWDATTVFRQWADALRKRGIAKVANLLIDDSVFEQNGIHPHWPADQMQLRYSAEVGGLNLNTNCVDFFLATTTTGNYCTYRSVPSTDYLTVKNVCVSGGDNAIRLSRQHGTNNITLGGTCPQSSGVPVSVTVHDPALFTGTVLMETLKANGITFTGKVIRDRTIRTELSKPSTTKSAAGDWQPLAVHETPLSQALARANKDSVNLYAECLCKRLGFAVAGQSGSWENGTAAVGAFLKKIGVDESEFHLDDGSGLSKQNHISPHAIAEVLMYDYFGGNRQAFINSLSIAGSDGTLERRFPNSDLRGRVFGKSGFVRGVSSLSGFLEARDGNWYAFSILMNGIPELSNSAVKPLQEAIVRAVDANSVK